MPRCTRNKVQEAYDAYMRDKPDTIAVDTETTGVSWYDQAFCMTVAWDGEAHYLELSSGEARRVARLMLRTQRLVFHNAKFDLQKLVMDNLIKREELDGNRIEDTECMAALLNPHAGKRLKQLARELLGEETDEAKVVSKAKSAYQRRVKKETGKTIYSDDIGYHLLPRRAVYPYAIKDAEFTWKLYRLLRPKIKDSLLPLYGREMELTLVLMDIEANGMRVDVAYVDREIRVLNSNILSCELRIADLTGKQVWYPERQGQKTPEGMLNPNAWQQVIPAFADRGIEIPDTKESTLSELEDPFAAALLELRGRKKLLSTYMLSIKKDHRDGIIHPSYRQHAPKTGRMSSGAASAD